MDREVFGINPVTKRCKETRKVYVSYESPEVVIQRLKEAAEGLDNPMVEARGEEDYDLTHYYMEVTGERDATDSEIADHNTRQNRDKRWREHLANFKG